MLKKIFLVSFLVGASLSYASTINTINNVDGVISWKLFLKEQNVKRRLYKVLSIDSEQNAYNYLNILRQKCGMTTLKYNDILAKSAKNHAKYLVDNNLAPGHYEDPGFLGFTGEWPLDRAIYAGYLSRKVSENLSAGDEDSNGSIDGLFSAIYHRFGFLDFSIDEVGVGAYENDNYYYKAIFVYNMGNSLLNSLCSQDFTINGAYYYNVCSDMNKNIPKENYDNAITSIEKQNPEVVFWPPKDYNDTPPVFYEESPDPLPDYSVSGYPISIQFNPYYYNPEDIEFLSFELQDSDGNLIDTIYMDKNSDPNDHFPDMAYAIFPKQRLDWNKKYYVKARFYINNDEKVFNWSFKTRALPYPYYKIDSNEVTLKIKPNQEYALYFVPLSKDDILSSYSYSYSNNDIITIDSIDLNTLYIKIDGNIGDEIVFNLSNGKKAILVLSNEDNAITYETNQNNEENLSQPNDQNTTEDNTQNETIVYIKNHINIGWNLFGAIEDFNCSDMDFNYSIIWSYDNGKWKAYSKDTKIMKIINSKFEALKTIKKGEGFWILK